MTDRQFLEWIHARLEFSHGENPNVDYMLRLKRIIAAIDVPRVGERRLNGRPDLMHLVKSIEREAKSLPDDTRAGMEMRVRVVIENAARLLVGIRDDAKAMAAKGGDDE